MPPLAAAAGLATGFAPPPLRADVALDGSAAAAFRANLTGIAGDASDRIIYETDTGRLFYDSDGNGAAGRFLFATIANHATLANTEFVVI